MVAGAGQVNGSVEPTYTARLAISCSDRPGIVAAVSTFLYERGANIISSHQYSSDAENGRFFLRTEFFLHEAESAEDRKRLEAEFAAEVVERFQMEWRMRWWGEKQRVAILVSKQDHCLMELLWRWRRGELDAEIVSVISNHPDLADEALSLGIPFSYVPVEKGKKPEAEAKILELLHGQADLLVLARYMQIVSGDFLDRVGMPAINIHHSFLPAFAGASPYQQAHDRGVKLIGATAHYVTEELDAGPIIEQDVVRVTHQETAQDLARVGRDVERMVLARAVALHLGDRVIVDGHRTVVF